VQGGHPSGGEEKRSDPGGMIDQPGEGAEKKKGLLKQHKSRRGLNRQSVNGEERHLSPVSRGRGGPKARTIWGEDPRGTGGRKESDMGIAMKVSFGS